MTTEPGVALQLGARAPDFCLPAIDRDGTVSLADYRGKRPVLLGLFRGLWCPFCRRTIARVGSLREQLDALGVDALGIVATTPENARLYFRFHPTQLPLAADPDLTTHHLFGLPKPDVTPELLQQLETTPINPTGEFPEALPLPKLVPALDAKDHFQPTATDAQDHKRQATQMKGQFLIDREGIILWLNIECATDGLAGVGKFPSNEELLAAARSLPA